MWVCLSYILEAEDEDESNDVVVMNVEGYWKLNLSPKLKPKEKMGKKGVMPEFLRGKWEEKFLFLSCLLQANNTWGARFTIWGDDGVEVWLSKDKINIWQMVS